MVNWLTALQHKLYKRVTTVIYKMVFVIIKSMDFKSIGAVPCDTIIIIQGDYLH